MIARLVRAIDLSAIAQVTPPLSHPRLRGNDSVGLAHPIPSNPPNLPNFSAPSRPLCRKHRHRPLRQPVHMTVR